MRGSRALACVLLMTATEASAADAGAWLREHVHGFASQGFLASTRNNYLNESDGGDFRFTEAGLNASTALHPDVSIGAQAFLRELGPLGNYEVELAWGFLDWHRRADLGLRLGAFKLPYGLYNETADVDAARTPILLPQSVYNLQYRDFQTSATGAAAYGSAPTRAGTLSYQLHFGWTFLETDGSVARTLEDFSRGALRVDHAHPIPGTGAALIWEAPGAPVRAGVTFQRYLDGELAFRIDPAARAPGIPERSSWTVDAFDMHVFSLEYRPSLWTLVAEYGQWNGDLANPYFPAPVHDERYYAQVSRVLRPDLEASAYWSVYHPDRNDRDGNRLESPERAYQKDLAVSLRFDVTDRWIAKVEGHEVVGTAALEHGVNPDGMARRWRYLATKLTLAF